MRRVQRDDSHLRDMGATRRIFFKENFMRSIFKYQLSTTLMKLQTVRMPVGADVLTAQAQKHVLTLWALSGTSPDILQDRKFRVVPTGVEYEKPGSYLSTVQMGELVFHVFEEV